MSDRTVWVFDTGPLRHFARNGWIGVLKYLAMKNDAEVVTPLSVRRELEEQRATIPELVLVLDADWIRVDRLDVAGQEVVDTSCGWRRSQVR